MEIAVVTFTHLVVSQGLHRKLYLVALVTALLTRFCRDTSETWACQRCHNASRSISLSGTPPAAEPETLPEVGDKQLRIAMIQSTDDEVVGQDYREVEVKRSSLLPRHG